MLDEAMVIVEGWVNRYLAAKPGSTYWCCLQAASLGLSFLRRAKQLNIKTPEGLDALRKEYRRQIVKDPEVEVEAAVEAAVEVEAEKL